MLSTTKTECPALAAVCVSQAGRDKGNTYIIIKVESPEFVLVADGKTKTVSNPKKKRFKHIKTIPNLVAIDLLPKILDNKLVDNEIHKFLLKVKI